MLYHNVSQSANIWNVFSADCWWTSQAPHLPPHVLCSLLLLPAAVKPFPLPPSTHTCSLCTKWMLQSHLIGLHFRIQGHLKCLFNNISFPTELLLTVFGKNALVSCGHLAVSLFILKMFCPLWLLVGCYGFSFLAWSKWYKKTIILYILLILVILEQLAHALATSSVPFFPFLSRPLPLLWLSQR